MSFFLKTPVDKLIALVVLAALLFFVVWTYTHTDQKELERKMQSIPAPH